MSHLLEGPRRPRPDFEAQNKPDPHFPIYDSRLLRDAPEVADYGVMAPRELAALAVAYRMEAISCDALARQVGTISPSAAARALWRERWECCALAARLAAQCCDSRLKALRRRPRR